MHCTASTRRLSFASILGIMGLATTVLVAQCDMNPTLPTATMKPHSGADPISELMRGRCMLPIPVQGSLLIGRTPKGDGAPFSIMSGSEVLWQGGANEAFRLPVSTMNHLYLLSSGARQTQWQNLQWLNVASSTRHRRSQQAAPILSLGIPKTLHASDFGLYPGMDDAGPALRRMVSAARSWVHEHGGEVKISLSPGQYHLRPASALNMSLYISNHDQQDVHPVGLPLVDLQNITLEGNGAELICHGMMLPVLIQDAAKVCIRNLSIDYATPFYSEGRIIDCNEGTTTLEFPDIFSWSIRNGKFYNSGEGWHDLINTALAFKSDGRMVPLGMSGDLPWPQQAEQVADNRVRFPKDAFAQGLSIGDIVLLRSFRRPHPAMVVYRTSGLELENVEFRDSQGMALIAQRSEDITIRGGGCIRHGGRLHTVSADATHFSNCRGHILVENALYEGMMDDAINVHSTCLSIQEVLSPTEILCRYVHPQAVGFEVLLPGETLQFIKGPTLENHPILGRAKNVVKTDETHLRITLEEPLPEGIGEGDAFENADWYPSVTFRNNTVRHNRARGSLFTTPKPILVEGNRFVWSSGSAILLAGDAQGWYESGRCRQVIIRNNLFDHNLTNRFQFTDGIISIYPEVRQPEEQKERYHENILIEGNTFLTHRVPLIYAISAKGVIFRGNTVQYDDLYPPLHGGKPFIFRHCEKLQMQDIPEKR